jgi:hypothetical protein
MTSILSHFLDSIKQSVIADSLPSRRIKHEQSLAEHGCPKDTILVQGRNGDFFGFSVKTLESCKPLFTDKIILDGIELYESEEFDAIIRLFEIKQELLLYGYSVIDYTILKYLQVNKIKLDIKQKFDYTLPELDSRMKLTRSDQLICKLEIVNIGNNVVPTEWIGRQFDNANQLHQAIDKLDYRKGSPPVTYCCIYGMSITEKKIVQLVKNIHISDKTTIIVEINSNCTSTLVSSVHKITKTCFVEYFSETHRLLICFNPEENFVSDAELSKNSVGLLSSTLQKCIRHGRCSKELVEQTVVSLARSKPYNLPEQNYLKVSGCRQLFWRLFITIIEDFRYYDDSDFLSPFDILVFALVCNKEPDYVISDNILDKIKNLAIRLTLCDSTSDYHEWRTYKNIDSSFSLEQCIPLTTMFIADKFIPKMSGDSVMISRYNTLLKTYIPLPLSINTSDLTCKKCEVGFTPKYTSLDIHCYPAMILHLQGSIREKKTTQEISSLIWELNSKFNNRRPEQFLPEMFSGNLIGTIFSIQKEYWGEYSTQIEDQESKVEYLENSSISINLNAYQRRSLFLKLFGQKLKIKSKKVLEVTFHVDDLFRIKYVNSDEFLKDTDYTKEASVVWKYLMENTLEIIVPDCISGYRWIFPNTVKKIQIGVTKDKKPFISYGKDKIIELDWFDGGLLVLPIEKECPILPTKGDLVIIKNMVRINKLSDLFKCNWISRNSNRTRCIRLSEYRHSLFSSILVKIYTANENCIEISQVTRNGEKVDNSVDYENEGIIWSLFNLLHYCYPKAVTITGNLKFRIYPNTSQYIMLIEDLDIICERVYIIGSEVLSSITIQTPLWNHQKDTVDFILENVKAGKKGFGDASNVGAGKTLSALSTICELYKYNRIKKVYSLILLPTEKLYKTWKDEIDKHLGKSIGVLEQQANGSLKGKEVDGLNVIITTMGRNREHMLDKKWLFLVIDECLTVQNKEAQQTMSAWIQSIHSKFGVLLLSATFFRTRFDKLLYMLKMLQCDLPETKEYLDTILCDSIKVHLPDNNREWTEIVTKYELEETLRDGYNTILNSDLSNEIKYVRLNKFIHEQVDYINLFGDTISSLEAGAKALIYAESKSEADKISKSIKDVGLYPDISKRHVVVSYANGTYGLNDLVGFNTLVTRPPEPDKLPQMKGRLDRPGQKCDKLTIDFILLENTIEEASYLRIDLCNKFYSNHIMPLSEFYSLAVK